MFECPKCGGRTVVTTVTQQTTTVYDEEGNVLESNTTVIDDHGPGNCEGCGAEFDQETWNKE